MNYANHIAGALESLRKGEVILYPTDTIWGLGCDATNPAAVEKLLAIKERDPGKGMIVLVSDERMLNQYVKDVPGPAWDLIEAADKPLTIIYEGINPRIASKVLAEDHTCAIRLVKDEFCQGLITRFGKPIVSTSANFSGKPAPASFKDIDPQLIQMVNHVVSFPGREKQNMKPSSVIRLKNNGEVKVIRD